MSYWKNENKVELDQTQVSIPSTNGKSYAGTAGAGGARVDFEIPPSVKFLDGKNSYLQFDIKLGLPAGAVPTRLQLDPFIGGQSVVKNLRIYSGSRAVLLEEISDYNVKVGVQYSYNQDDSLRKMRAMKEGCMINTVENRGTLGTSVSNCIDLDTNPYYKPVPTVPATRDWGTADDFVTAKVSLPLHCGIFADSSKVFPCLMTDGLYIEVDLEDPSKIITQLDSVNRHRRMQQNPLFHGIDAVGTQMIVSPTVTHTSIFLAKDNNMISVAQCPFVKGETFGICSKTDPNQQANLTTDADAAVNPVITDITMDGGFVKLTVANTRNSSADGLGGVTSGVAVTSGNFILYSAAIDQKRIQVVAPNTEILAPITAYRATYQISNMALVCQKVSLDPRYEAGMIAKVREGGAIELDIPSATNYKHSLLSSNRNATINMAVSNTRAKSVIVVPTDASVYNTAQLIGGLGVTYDEEQHAMDGRLHSSRSGLCGIIDELSSYQFVIDDKLVPSRPIEVSKINKAKSIAAQPLLETEKALNQALIPARSFCDFNRNFVVGRAYALNNGVTDLNNKSNQLQLFYNETTAAGVDRPPVKDKLLMSFIFHVRRVTIAGDSITVTV
tara:strand:+ start:28 stop:1869 length:1842 start_codon:yes stop_codon:yes gene_type:complete